MQEMKKQYEAPVLVEYGQLTELTLGQGGTKPDVSFPGFSLINNSCNASGSTVLGCFGAT